MLIVVEWDALTRPISRLNLFLVLKKFDEYHYLLRQFDLFNVNETD